MDWCAMKWIRHLFIQSYGVEDPMVILPGLLWHQPGAHSVLLLCVLMLLTLIFSLHCSALSSQHSLLKWASSSENETQPLGMLGSVFVFKALVHPWALYFIMLLYFCQQFLHLAYALCQLLKSVFPQSKGHLWDCSANSSIHFYLDSCNTANCVVGFVSALGFTFHCSCAVPEECDA